MRKAGILAIAALLLLAACGKDAAEKPKAKEDADTPGVELKAEEVKSLGIATVPAKSEVWQRQVTGYGTVVSLDTIAQSDADYLDRGRCGGAERSRSRSAPVRFRPARKPRSRASSWKPPKARRRPTRRHWGWPGAKPMRPSVFMRPGTMKPNAGS